MTSKATIPTAIDATGSELVTFQGSRQQRVFIGSMGGTVKPKIAHYRHRCSMGNMADLAIANGFRDQRRARTHRADMDAKAVQQITRNNPGMSGRTVRIAHQQTLIFE
ncbi:MULTISPECIES: hypothetical protein [Acidovorax]|uniref:hypothetical protein n=1 Tax=Acidovorax TaxID=12916 RepID=UPI002588323A|nr:hypothetical protein [Acidovorax sp.]